MENTNTLRYYFATHFKGKVLETGVYVVSNRRQNAYICIPMADSIKSEFIFLFLYFKKTKKGQNLENKYYLI